jgi:hypothetical protein
MPLQQTSGNATADAFGGGVAVAPTYIEDVFSTYLYTGTGAAQTITNGIDLSGKGGLVWCKDRTVANGHDLSDTARGFAGNCGLNTASTAAATGSDITGATSSGFTLGNISGNANYNGDKIASWTFRKQPKFFDVVTYTGTGANRTIAHNIGGAVGCMLVKRTDQAGNWQVYHNSLTSAAYSIQLNLTDAQASAPTIWNSTAPTSSVFSVGTDATVNASGGTYVAYLFAHNAGGFGLTGTDNVISCGSFTGAYPLDVTLGWEPQYVLLKNSTSSSTWWMMDTLRGLSTTTVQSLRAENSSAEGAINDVYIEPTSTGFRMKVGAAGLGLGVSSTNIYIAIRRGPMKVPTDGTKVYNAIARTGTGAVATVTGVGFPPDLAITRGRSAGEDTCLTSKLIGPAKFLRSDRDSQEVTDTPSLTSFDMSGITVGPDVSYNRCNGNTIPYINWFFQRAPSFFDEVCYTGTGVARTVAHNLAAVPELMIVKSRSINYNWYVYVATLGAGKELVLNSANPEALDGLPLWNSTSPTSTVFTLGSDATVNQSGQTYVAYLFATCAGVSKVGSYTGNGTTQAIACGFAGGSRFVLIKRTDAAGDWYSYDTARGMTVLTDPYLLLNSTAAETATLGSVTSTTGGFTVNAAILAAINTNAASYIYLSIS